MSHTTALGIAGVPDTDNDPFDELVIGAAFDKIDALLQALGALPLAGANAGKPAVCYAPAVPGTQALSSGTWTATTFNAAAVDADGMHGAVGSRFTAAHVGWYLALGYLLWAPLNGAGIRLVQWYANGASAGAGYHVGNPGDGANADGTGDAWTVVQLAVGGYLELYQYVAAAGLSVAAAQALVWRLPT